MNDPTPGTLFDEHGRRVLGPADDGKDLNLPAGVQPLIETRMNSAIDDLRNENRREIETLCHSMIPR